MSTRTITAAVALATLAVATGAYGRATAEPFHGVQTTIDTGVLDYSCFEGIEGNGMTTDVIDGHLTENANGFHFHGVVHREYTLAFADGTHILGRVSQHIEFNATRNSTTDTEPSQERATIYAADGRVVGTIRQQGIFHLAIPTRMATANPTRARSPRSSSATACSAHEPKREAARSCVAEILTSSESVRPTRSRPLSVARRPLCVRARRRSHGTPCG
jgi:hypothetical protein